VCGSTMGLSPCSHVSPQPGGAPPELLTAAARLSRGLLPPSPGTYKEGEGSFPGPFPQPCSPADANIRFLSRSYCSFSLLPPSPPALTINQVALPRDHLMQLIPHMKTTSRSSLPRSPPSMALAWDAGRAMGGEDAPYPPTAGSCLRLQAPFPGVAGRNPSAHALSPAPGSSSPFQPLSQGKVRIKRKQIKPNGLIAIIFPLFICSTVWEPERRKGNALDVCAALVLIMFPATERPSPAENKTSYI